MMQTEAEMPDRDDADHSQSLNRGGIVEELVFGTGDVAEIDGHFARFCATELGSGVVETLFRATSVGVVVGARLADERRVVVKAHQPREDRAALEAVHRVQLHLHREGFPAPEPLVGPTPLVNGLAVAEEMVTRGELRDTHAPHLRQQMAEALATQLEIAKACAPEPTLERGWNLYDGASLWPREAHAPMFDFDSTAVGAEWIDALATEVKPLTLEPSERLIGHTDWSGKHFRFDDEGVAVIYDWDSIRVRSEVQIVGNAAMTFTTNFDLEGVRLTPSPEEMHAFIDDYSGARSTPLTTREREQVEACALFIATYTARCEHCAHNGYDAINDPHSFTAALLDNGDAYLRLRRTTAVVGA